MSHRFRDFYSSFPLPDSARDPVDPDAFFPDALVPDPIEPQHRFPRSQSPKKDAHPGPSDQVPGGGYPGSHQNPDLSDSNQPFSDLGNAPVDPQTLQVIREAANRQWRQLQDLGVESRQLLKLAGEIWESIKFSADLTPDWESQTLECEEPAVAQIDEWSDLDNSANRHPTQEFQCLYLGDRESMVSDGIKPLKVSMTAFLEFALDVSDGLNQLVQDYSDAPAELDPRSDVSGESSAKG